MSVLEGGTLVVLLLIPEDAAGDAWCRRSGVADGAIGRIVTQSLFMDTESSTDVVMYLVKFDEASEEVWFPASVIKRVSPLELLAREA